jgi:phage head maturation protease
VPLNRCRDDDKPGWKWGDAGKCYTYTAGNEASEKAARKKAMAQAAAMGEFPGTGIEHRAELKAKTINDLPDSAFAYIEPGGKKDEDGKTVPRSKRHFPIHDAAHVRNALARVPQSPFGAKAMPKIRAAAKKFGVHVSEERSQSSLLLDDAPLAPVEFREASVSEVKFPQRLVTVVAMPYDEPAIVEYRGELWEESFERGAFDGIEKRPNRVRANRDHDRQRTVGKVNNFWPAHEEGLVAEVRIAQTPLGDETLALADEDILGVSAGFAARGRDQVFNRSTQSRRIKRAFLDHLAFTATPAYKSAMPIDVRDGEPLPNAADLPPLITPALDEVRAWLQARKVR